MWTDCWMDVDAGKGAMDGTGVGGLNGVVYLLGGGVCVTDFIGIVRPGCTSLEYARET